MYRAALLAAVLSLAISIVLACLASSNSNPDFTTTAIPTTTYVCRCQFPRNTAAPECGAGPVNPLPTFQISQGDPCLITWTGCTNYRYVVNGVCMTGPQNANPATVQGGFTCDPTQSSFPQSNGMIYQGVDCG